MLEKIKSIKSSIIALKKRREQKEMPNLICPNCQGIKRTNPITVTCEPQAKMWGIIKCLDCGHELPITIDRGFIQKIDVDIPGQQSNRLNPSVPSDIQEDVREAERANYAQCCKACVTMCRRALQLGLIDNGIPDGFLTGMLEKALAQRLLKQKTHTLATTIKGYGDIGSHRRETLNPMEVNMVIYATVEMLNELFPKSQATV